MARMGRGFVSNAIIVKPVAFIATPTVTLNLLPLTGVGT